MRRFTANQIDKTEPDEPFKLDPARVLFVLHETHFASPPDYNLQLAQDPHAWFNETMAAIHIAIEPVFAPELRPRLALNPPARPMTGLDPKPTSLWGQRGE